MFYKTPGIVGDSPAIVLDALESKQAYAARSMHMCLDRSLRLRQRDSFPWVYDCGCSWRVSGVRCTEVDQEFKCCSNEIPGSFFLHKFSASKFCRDTSLAVSLLYYLQIYDGLRCQIFEQIW